MECVTLDALGAEAPFSKTETDSLVGLHNYFTKEQKVKLGKRGKTGQLEKYEGNTKKIIIPLLPVVLAVVFIFFLFKVRETLIREK